MVSNTNSEGRPIDHDGEILEDGMLGGGSAPIAISDVVFKEIFGRSGLNVAHLGTSTLEGLGGVTHSSSGGIPVVENVTVEDYVSSEDEPLSPRAARDLSKSNTSDTIQAMLRTTKHERDELFRARKKLMLVLKFLRFKGFSEEEIYNEFCKDDSDSGIPKRGEFGLPELPTVVAAEQTTKDDKVFVEMPTPTQATISAANPLVDKMKGKLTEDSDTKGAKADSWARVVKKDTQVVNFKYFPMAKGATVVDPPDEVLLKGIDKFKNSIVGTFPKGTHSYKTVSEFVFKFWKHKGLVSVHQKDTSTFLFRFEDSRGAFEVLSRGTWYIDRRPLIVTPWGQKPGANVITNMPLWVKLSNVPDCYWTDEGLARIASVIGEPLGADGPTSKLEILPFAKMQVRYTLGDPLPNDISVSVLDPVSKERSVAKVLVSYPVRPLFCTGCQSLGHSVPACPKVTRVWKPKESKPPVTTDNSQDHEVNVIEQHTLDGTTGQTSKVQDNAEDVWTEVKRKKCSSPGLESPSPPITFKNLKQVDEIDGKKGIKCTLGGSPKRLTKSQKRKLKASQGSSPSSLS